MVAAYDGTDNAPACVNIATKNINDLNLQDKVKAFLFEAVNLNEWLKKYDLVITTWFTAGNFYPDNFPFETYQIATGGLGLSRKKKI